jgi:hypothetical protein
VGFVLPVRIAAQVSELQQRQSEYETAKLALTAHSSAWSTQELAWQATLDTVNAAIRSGDRNRREAADFRSQAAAFELQRLQVLVDNAKRDLETKRRALEDAIDREIVNVGRRLRTASPAERTALNNLLGSLDAQLEQLQSDAATSNSEILVYLPGLNPDPRMTPLQVSNLLAFMDNQLMQTRSEIERVDADLNRALQLQNRQRNAGDLQSTLRRFGGDQPVGASQPTNAAGSETAAPTPSLEERIKQLRAQKASLLDMMRQLDVRVSTIRRTLGGLQDE